MKYFIILSIIVVVGLSFAEGQRGLWRPVLQRRQASSEDNTVDNVGEYLEPATQEGYPDNYEDENAQPDESRDARFVSEEVRYARGAAAPRTRAGPFEVAVTLEGEPIVPTGRDERYYVSEEVRDARGAAAPGTRCFRTGCAPIGLKEYCGAGIVEVARETCISGRIDVTCCTASAVPVLPSGGASVPSYNGGGNSDPNKGRWVQGGKCFTTGCAPVGLPAYCPANVRETSRTQCIAQGRIDVTCCL